MQKESKPLKEPSPTEKQKLEKALVYMQNLSNQKGGKKTKHTNLTPEQHQKVVKEIKKQLSTLKGNKCDKNKDKPSKDKQNQRKNSTKKVKSDPRKD